MPREPGNPAKLLEWSPRAWVAYSATLAFIADEDPVAAKLVKDRVERALTQIAAFPGIGTPGTRRGLRRFPVNDQIGIEWARPPIPVPALLRDDRRRTE